eukprot:1758427-Amphidinium_carterae.1
MTVGEAKLPAPESISVTVANPISHHNEYSTHAKEISERVISVQLPSQFWRCCRWRAILLHALEVFPIIGFR